MIRNVLPKRMWKKVVLIITLVVANTIFATSTYSQSSLIIKDTTTNFGNTSQEIFIQGKGYQKGQYDLGAAEPTPFNWTRQTQINIGYSPQYKWTADIGGEGISSPVTASDGTIYARSWGDGIDGVTQAYLKAINKDGSTKWSIPVGTDPGSSPVIASDGTVIMGSGLYNQSTGVYGFNPDGTQKFYYPTKGSIHSTPAIGSDGTIYVMDSYGTIYAINSDGTGGRVIFKSYSNFGSSSSQTIVIGQDGTLYFIANSNGNLYAMDPNGNGTRKWVYSTFDGPISTPTIGDDGTIYVGIQIFSSQNGHLYAFRPDGTIKWGFNFIGKISPSISPVISKDGTIYIGDDNTTYAVKSDGTLKWSLPVKMNSTPILGADGTLYVNSADPSNNWQNMIEAISPEGERKWSTSIAPNIGINVPLSIGNNGTLYAFATDGKLYAYQDTTPPPVPEVNLVGDNDRAVTGSAEIKSTIMVKAGTGVLGTAVVKDDGTFSVPIDLQKPGTILTITAIDAAGNVSKEKEVTIKDVTAPNIPTVNDVTDKSTSITGLAEAGSTITVKTGTSVLGTAVVKDDGTFSVPIALQKAGSTLLVTATDNIGNVSHVNEVIVKDVTEPNSPTVSTVTDLSTSVTGTSEAGSTVTVKAGTTVLGTGVTKDDGTFSVPIDSLKAGTTLSITASDQAGNVSKATIIIIKAVKLTGWQKIDGNWYFYTSEGNLYKGWLKSGSNWYYLDRNGVMRTGWLLDGGKWYYLDPANGDMKTDWLYTGGKWYYLDPTNGDMKTGWLYTGGKWYYLNSNGDMQTQGWKSINNIWYYFYSDGSMAANSWIGNYWVNSSGAWVITK